MGVQRFNAADWVRFSTLATALQNTSNGAWTLAVLLKRAVNDTLFHGLSYLCSAGPVTEAGLSIDSSDTLRCDVAGHSEGGLAITSTTETHIAVGTKADGNQPITTHLFSKSSETWATPDVTTATLVNQSAATLLEIGTWQGGSDLADAWIGLVGWWEGDMSTANVQTLDDNWRTSDWYGNAHGTPTALIEMNVAAASLVDLIGNATDLSVTGTPTLDSGETLVNWDFDGIAAEPEPTAVASNFPSSPLRW